MRHITLAVAALATVTVGAQASAATIAWDGSGSSDAVSLSQFGDDYTNVASGTSFQTDTGITGTFSTSLGNGALRIGQGEGWGGNFADGAPLLWNQGTQDDLIFTFAHGVSAAGAQFQSDYYGSYTAQITLSDGSSFTQDGVATDAGDNSAVFIGARSDSANISSITFHALNTTANGNDFAIGNLSLIAAPTAAVPEPATWAMMIGGIGIAGGALRRRRGNVSTTVRFA